MRSGDQRSVGDKQPNLLLQSLGMPTHLLGRRCVIAYSITPQSWWPRSALKIVGEREELDNGILYPFVSNLAPGICQNIMCGSCKASEIIAVVMREYAFSFWNTPYLRYNNAVHKSIELQFLLCFRSWTFNN